MERALKSNPFPDNVDKSFVLQKSKIVISSEIGITCDELGRFIAIHSVKLDVKHQIKKKIVK
jgi:L-serine deaminase